MKELNTDKLKPAVAESSAAFFKAMLSSPAASSVSSIHIVGSAATDYFRPGLSDINSIVALNRTDHDFVKHVAALGKTFAKKSVSAPILICTSDLTSSADTFPIEFLNYKLMHTTILGEDIFDKADIDRHHLRLQCEREIRLLHLNLYRQYIANFGKSKHIAGIITFALKNSIPLFRAIISLMGGSPAINKHEVVSQFITCAGMESGIIETALQIREGVLKPSGQELEDIFFQYCSAIEKTSRLINDLHVQ